MPETDAQQQEQQSQQGASQGGSGGEQQQAPARPDYVPEKFWKDGAANVEALGKSYLELEKQRGKFAETAKATARQEVEGELWGNRPEKPEAYPMAAPEDAVDVGIFVGPPPADFAPEPGKTYLSLNPDSKALGMLRGIAHKAGTSPEEFQSLLTEVARENGIRVPTEADQETARQKLYAELGEGGQRRVQHLWGSMRAVLGDQASDLEGVIGNAKAVQALEEVMARATGSRFAPANAGTGGGALTEAEIYSEMRKPEYQRGDSQAVARVAGMWKTLYPG